MLMLTRRPGEWVEVTDKRTGEVVMRLYLSQVKGMQVSLGFEAPLHIRIMRDNAVNRVPKRNADI